jgi:hypothetical protein
MDIFALEAEAEMLWLRQWAGIALWKQWCKTLTRFSPHVHTYGPRLRAIWAPIKCLA